MKAVVGLRVAPALRLFLPRRGAASTLELPVDGTSSLGHLVQSTGLPLTEVGSMTVEGRDIPASARDLAGQVVDITPPSRPQYLDGWPRLVLDVHLGSLARRLRLLGIDTAYSTQAADEELVQAACEQGRILLTKDRGILRRRLVLDRAAYVRGDRTDEQMRDVLDRLGLPLAPLTRCVACNDLVHPVDKGEVESRLQPGTARSYDIFSECGGCGRVYWRGAHSSRLDAAVEAGLEALT